MLKLFQFGIDLLQDIRIIYVFERMYAHPIISDLSSKCVVSFYYMYKSLIDIQLSQFIRERINVIYFETIPSVNAKKEVY